MWPKNDDGYWNKAKTVLTDLLLAIPKGGQMTIDEIKQATDLTKSQIRSVLWHARCQAAKRPDGGVYRFRDNIIYRMTDAEASENGARDTRVGRRHFQRSKTRLKSVNTSVLDREQEMKHRLLEAQMWVAEQALSPQKRTAAQRQICNGNMNVNVGDLYAMFSKKG